MPGIIWAQAPPSTPSSFPFTYEIDLIPNITSFDCGYARRSIINNNLTTTLVCFGLIGNRPSTPPANATGVVLRSDGFTRPDGTLISRLSFSGTSTVSNIAEDSRLTNVLVAPFNDLDVDLDVAWFNFNSIPPDGAPNSFFYTKLQNLLTKMAPLAGYRTAYKEIDVHEVVPSPVRLSPPPAQAVSGAAKGDCNGDGKADVIVPVIGTINSDTVVSVLSFIQKGRGGFFYPQKFDLTFPDPDGGCPLCPLKAKQFSHGIVRIAKIDGDDYADYALLLVRGETDAGTAGSGELYVIYGVESSGGLCSVDVPSTSAQAANFGAGTNPAGLAIADFDNDGLKDFAVLLKGNGGTAVKGVRILYNDGVVPLATGPHLVRTGSSPTVTPEGLAVGDFDNDGRMDFAFGDSAAPRFYYARNRIGTPGAVSQFDEVKAISIDNPVEDIKFQDADFCYGGDILVLHKGNGGNAKLSVHGAKRPEVTLTILPSPEVSTTAGKPVTVRANLTNRDKVNPAFKWTVAGGPTDPPLRIMNQFAADPTFTALKPGEYRVRLSVDFKPNFKKYGRTVYNCPGPPGPPMSREIIIHVGPAEEVSGTDTPTPAFSPDQIVPPGGRACFFCGAPRSGVHRCSATQTDGPEVEISCSERAPLCCFDIPMEEPEEGVISFTVEALDFAGTPIVSAPASNLLFQEAEDEEEEEEEEEESSTTSQTITFLVSEEAPISEVTASITGATETVTAGGTASYSLTGACSATDEGTTTTASWYAEDPDDLVVDDPTAAETSYVKYLSGETELTLLCSATDDESGSTLVSEPASMTIMGLTTEEEFAAGNGLAGGCSLVK